jgi:hypothetical protein
MAAEDSVRVLREMRPGSIETSQQQRFVGEYSNRLWRLYSSESITSATAADAAAVDEAHAAFASPRASPEGASGATADTDADRVEKSAGGSSSRGGAAAAAAGASSNSNVGGSQRMSIGGGRAASKGLKLPKLVLLVGLPGSGKSTFADRLVASGSGWVRICQDECGGSRRDCEGAFANATLRGSDYGRHVILDR